MNSQPTVCVAQPYYGHQNLRKCCPLQCSKKAQWVFGILMILTAVTSVAFGIASIVMPTFIYGFFGSGLWGGAIVFTAGILCLCSSKTDNKCVAVSALVMNIISILVAIDQMTLMSIAAGSEYDYEDEDRCHWNYFSHFQYEDCAAEVAIDGVLIAIGAVELGLAITCVCLLSVSVCCSGTRQTIGMIQQPLLLHHGGSSAAATPVFPPQTHFVTPSGQMYVHQPPRMQQYAASQSQQLPTGNQQQYPEASNPQGKPFDQQSGQPTGAAPPPQQYQADHLLQQNPAGGEARHEGINPHFLPPYSENN
ncbi:uncharacterized protein [Antedon mediterranea]|uniref:uncharacterized protein n=1 Tax=Antedon mediterranea TaxID=105859 RepID=UPI003AF7313E